MTVLVVTVIVAAAILTFVLMSRTRDIRVRRESLGDPHPDRPEPVVRSESRHNDSPNAVELDNWSARRSNEGSRRLP